MQATGPRSARTALLVVAIAVAVVVPRGRAFADGLDAERFAPAAGAYGGFHVEHPVVPFHLGVGLGLFVDLADDPLVVVDDATGDVLARPLDTAVTANLLASIGLWNRLELAAHLPVHLVYDGDDAAGGGVSAGGGVGDLRFVPKLTLYRAGNADRHAVFGFAVPVSVPTGDEEQLRGAGGVTIAPTALAAVYFGRLGLLGNLGYRWRSEHPAGLPWGDEIAFALGVTYELSEALEVEVDLAGARHVSTDVDGAGNVRLPVELLGGVSYRAGDSWVLYGGAGLGVTEGLGEPDFRIVTGVRYRSRMPARHGFGDSDSDGILDKDDDCPFEAEDIDGFRDSDGCPDPDNDRDGVLDDDDECPELPEDGDDGDGCPSKTYVKIVDGQLVIFGKVLFRTSSDEIDGRSEALVDQVAAALNANPEAGNVRIEGHTDDVGDDDANLALSEARARSVKRELVERGVSSERVSTKGYGETRPVAPNHTRAGRAKNRRVEFILDK
jgi:outer membrane protein OmpA-like peptidoglycan-associated protein